MEIKICKNCKGYGKVETYEDIPSGTIDCSTCNGSGKVFYRSYELILPFDQGVKFRSTDGKILEIIRESKQIK